jgi:hypothetical protein
MHMQVVTTTLYSTRFTDSACTGCYNWIQHVIYWFCMDGLLQLLGPAHDLLTLHI